MTLALKLNRRHKAALFVTLVAAGASLVSGDAMKIGLGIVLLGVAFAWAFGSDSRVEHFLFLVCGLLIVIATLIHDWREHLVQSRRYRDEVTEFESRVPNFAKSYPLLLAMTSPLSQLKHSPPKSLPPTYVGVEQPDGGIDWYPPDAFLDPPPGLQLTREQLAHAIKTREPAYRTLETRTSSTNSWICTHAGGRLLLKTVRHQIFK
jgi:hypothetical protein